MNERKHSLFQVYPDRFVGIYIILPVEVHSISECVCVCVKSKDTKYKNTLFGNALERSFMNENSLYGILELIIHTSRVGRKYTKYTCLHLPVCKRTVNPTILKLLSIG